MKLEKASEDTSDSNNFYIAFFLLVTKKPWKSREAAKLYCI